MAFWFISFFFLKEMSAFSPDNPLHAQSPICHLRPVQLWRGPQKKPPASILDMAFELALEPFSTPLRVPMVRAHVDFDLLALRQERLTSR